MVHVPYVYRLTDRETGKRYIGSRYSRVCEPADLGVKYFTSSKTVNPLFKANPERFEKQIIVTGTREYVRRVEFTLIELYDAVMSEEFYNRSNARGVHPDDCAKGGRKNIESGLLAKIRTFEVCSAGGKKGSLVTHSKKTVSGKSAHGVRFAEQCALIGGVIMGERNRVSGHMSKVGKQYGPARGKINSESGQVQALAAKNNSQLWRCVDCGKISTPGPLTRHLTSSGHSTKERIG